MSLEQMPNVRLRSPPTNPNSSRFEQNKLFEASDKDLDDSRFKTPKASKTKAEMRQEIESDLANDDSSEE